MAILVVLHAPVDVLMPPPHEAHPPTVRRTAREAGDREGRPRVGRSGSATARSEPATGTATRTGKWSTANPQQETLD